VNIWRTVGSCMGIRSSAPRAYIVRQSSVAADAGGWGDGSRGSRKGIEA
jgi:hypothetical protein